MVRLHTETLHALYSSPNIIRVINLRRRWAGNAARMERTGSYRVWWGDLREGEHLENPGVNGGGDNIKADLKEVGWEMWTGWIWLKIGVGDRLL